MSPTSDARPKPRSRQTSYNYPHFRPEFYDLASFDGPQVGEPFPDFELTSPDGSVLRLSELLNRTLVLEMGSVTCPMYAKGVEPMQALAERFVDTTFAVLYVREAHPGGRIGPHLSLADKQRRAASLTAAYGERRVVLVDDVAGTAHRALGSLPNAVYVIGRDGLVQFRGDWTEPTVIEAVLGAPSLLVDRERFRPAIPSPGIALRALLYGGPDALWDFVRGLRGLIRLHKASPPAASAAGRR